MSEQGQIEAGIAARWWSDYISELIKPEADALVRFESALRNIIMQGWTQGSYRTPKAPLYGNYPSIRVDYTADVTLKVAADFAGLPIILDMKVKTAMWIKTGSVIVHQEMRGEGKMTVLYGDSNEVGW